LRIIIPVSGNVNKKERMDPSDYLLDKTGIPVYTLDPGSSTGPAAAHERGDAK
jgi:hypothetical protein